MHVLGYQETPGKIDKSCQLVGGKENFEIILKHLKIVLNGYKFDTLTLNSILHGVKQARIEFLKPIECHKYKRLLLLAVFKWLFEDYIFMIIRSNFYVTDTSQTNSELFFYKKSDWKRIVNDQFARNNYKFVYNLEKIKESNVVSYCSRSESYGFHLGRVFPKNFMNECRIISGCKIFNPCTNKMYQSNWKFYTLNSCLTWLISNNPDLIGFACRGNKEILKKYLNFVNYNSFNRAEHGFKKWNLGKFDLDKCYDTINSKELISYVGALFEREMNAGYVFSLMRFIRISFDHDCKQLKFKYEFLTIKHHFHAKAFQNGISDFIQVLESRNTNPKESMVFVPTVIHDRDVSLLELKNALNLCMNHVVIKIHNDLYERTNGILQGSVCSRNLCDLYIGCIESSLFYYVNPQAKTGYIYF